MTKEQRNHLVDLLNELVRSAQLVAVVDTLKPSNDVNTEIQGIAHRGMKEKAASVNAYLDQLTQQERDPDASLRHSQPCSTETTS